MTTTSNPFGFKVVQHMSGSARLRQFQIASGLAENLYIGTPLALSAAGFVVTAATNEQNNLGIFAGCIFTNNNTNRVANVWVSGTQSSDAVAQVFDDPYVELEAQANGPITQAHIGDFVNIVNPTSGNAVAGQSFAGINATTSSTGVFEVIQVAPNPGNTVGDAFTVARVKYSLHVLK